LSISSEKFVALSLCSNKHGGASAYLFLRILSVHFVAFGLVM